MSFSLKRLIESFNYSATRTKFLALSFLDEMSPVSNLTSAAQSGDNEAVARYANKRRINKIDSKGWTALTGAATFGHVDTVKLLLEMGADVNQRGGGMPVGYADTPLIDAAKNGHIEVVKLLLKSGADASMKNVMGQDAIAAAESFRRKEIAELLKQWSPKQSKKPGNSPNP